MDNKFRPNDDPEFLAIKEGVGFLEFVTYMKDKDIYNLRLPVNNPEAFLYLRWLNEFYCVGDNSTYVNYVLNLWDLEMNGCHVRPPTPREVAICEARRLVELIGDEKIKDESEKRMCIDINAELIRDAYHYSSYPDWIHSGLAGCVMKWGTFEENEKPGDEYKIYEEYDK